MTEAATEAKGRFERVLGRRGVVPLIIVALLGQMAFAMLASARDDAPTYDEPSHLGGAVAYVELGDLRWSPEHPPLAKLLMGIGLRKGPGIEMPREGPEFATFFDFELGRHLLFGENQSPRHVIWWARLPMIALALGWALVVFGFARDVFGTPAALLSLALATLCPNLIAHGRLATTDVTVAGFTILACWFLWRAAHRSAYWFLPAGIAVGMALASKYTALFLLPALLLVAAYAASQAYEIPFPFVKAGRRALAMIAWPAAVLAVAFFSLWAVYLSIDPSLSYDRPPRATDKEQGILVASADLLPAPKPFREGIKQAINNQDLRPGFLFGRQYYGGRLDYYPVMLMIKTPVGTLAIWALGLLGGLFSRRRVEVAVYLLLPPSLLMASAMFSQVNVGIRHVMVVPLFMAVVGGGALQLRVRLKALIVSALVAATAVSVWASFPSQIAYANELFGGPSNARRVLSDSNVDWGQDLIRLSEYMREHHPGEPVWIGYFGQIPTDGYGLKTFDLTTAEPQEVRGLVALSASLMNSSGDTFDYVTKGAEPIEVIGHTILVFKME